MPRRAPQSVVQFSTFNYKQESAKNRKTRRNTIELHNKRAGSAELQQFYSPPYGCVNFTSYYARKLIYATYRKHLLAHS